MPKHILIVDDDPDISELLSTYLQAAGYQTNIANDGLAGIKAAYSGHPDLILLDVMMPGMDGWETCVRLREMSDGPIIFVTAKTNEADIVRGFSLGADDYITKPLSLHELRERVQAVLRRVEGRQRAAADIYDDGTLRVDLDGQRVWRAGRRVHLSPTESMLLLSLMRRAGAVVPHQTLIDEVWGADYADGNTSLSLYMHYLRHKLEADPEHPRYLLTCWGVGYLFQPGPAP